MGKIERQYKLRSLSINKDFIYSLKKIMQEANSGLDAKILIVYNFEEEKVIYENIEDFISDNSISFDFDTLSISIEPNKHQEGIKLQFKIDQDPKRAFYRLSGKDDGNLMSAHKKVENLISGYSNWYGFLFKFESLDGTLPLAGGVSLAILVYNFLLLINLLTENAGIIAFISFFIFGWVIKKIQNRFFPFMGLEIRIDKKKNFWRSVIGIICTGLIVNLIWSIISYLS